MKIALFALVGALAGLPLKAYTGRLVRERETEPRVHRMLCGRLAALAWIALSSLGPALIAAALPAVPMVRLIQYALMFFAILCLSAVDIAVRCIPNALLMAILLAFLGGNVALGDFGNILSGLLGAVVATVVFLFPSRMGMNIGWGDIKYAAVIGLCFGLAGLLQVTLVMGLALAVYAAYLLLTKRGNLFTTAAMGPYLSLGAMTTMVFPVLQKMF